MEYKILLLAAICTFTFHQLTAQNAVIDSILNEPIDSMITFSANFKLGYDLTLPANIEDLKILKKHSKGGNIEKLTSEEIFLILVKHSKKTSSPGFKLLISSSNNYVTLDSISNKDRHTVNSIVKFSHTKTNADLYITKENGTFYLAQNITLNLGFPLLLYIDSTHKIIDLKNLDLNFNFCTRQITDTNTIPVLLEEPVLFSRKQIIPHKANSIIYKTSTTKNFVCPNDFKSLSIYITFKDWVNNIETNSNR